MPVHGGGTSDLELTKMSVQFRAEPLTVVLVCFSSATICGALSTLLNRLAMPRTGYSARSAADGSTRAARLPGSHAAMTDAPSTIALASM
jgi:hypothetical protein